MTTCRDVLADAFAALGAIAFGGEPTADEIDGGLSAMAAVVLDIHAAREPMRQIDVGADFLASENQSVRVAAGAQVVVTLPNTIICGFAETAADFGFGANPNRVGVGLGGAADGVQSRRPRDGARIEIVGATQTLYFYRSDINAWVAVSPLTIDGPTPLNGRYDGALAALIAERLCDPMNVSPSPTLAKRISRGNAALMTRPATGRQPERSAYF